MVMKRLLVIGNAPALLELFRLAFRCPRYVLTEVPTLAAAAETLATEDTVDLVLLDDDLLDGGSLPFCRSLRQRRPGMRIVVIHPGRATARRQQEATSAGASILIGKPFGVPQLAATVGRLLGEPGPAT